MILQRIRIIVGDGGFEPGISEVYSALPIPSPTSPKIYVYRTVLYVVSVIQERITASVRAKIKSVLLMYCMCPEQIIS